VHIDSFIQQLQNAIQLKARWSRLVKSLAALAAALIVTGIVSVIGASTVPLESMSDQKMEYFMYAVGYSAPFVGGCSI
jgi:hypothetical protein